VSWRPGGVWTRGRWAPRPCPVARRLCRVAWGLESMNGEQFGPLLAAGAVILMGLAACRVVALPLVLGLFHRRP
jgi:hypothetical protein